MSWPTAIKQFHCYFLTNSAYCCESEYNCLIYKISNMWTPTGSRTPGWEPLLYILFPQKTGKSASIEPQVCDHEHDFSTRPLKHVLLSSQQLSLFALEDVLLSETIYFYNVITFRHLYKFYKASVRINNSKLKKYFWTIWKDFNIPT